LDGRRPADVRGARGGSTIAASFPTANYQNLRAADLLAI
jgi:hypothetical protein